MLMDLEKQKFRDLKESMPIDQMQLTQLENVERRDGDGVVLISSKTFE